MTPFRRILLATEHSVHDAGAEMVALALARRQAQPPLAVMPVLSNPEFEMIAPQLAARADTEVASRRQSLEATARAQQVSLSVQVRRGPEPYADIVDAAREHQADLIVIRRRGQRGLVANLLVGEMVAKVVAHAPCSVLVVPRGAQLWQRGVLAGVDPRQPEAPAVPLAARVAAEAGLPLHLACVAEDEPSAPLAARTLATALALARRIEPAAEGSVPVGRPHEQLTRLAPVCGADLLLVGRHGGERLARAWIGGTAQKVIGLAEAPVLVHLNPPAPSEP